jgi:mannopine transport system substrate-binding protein
MFGHLARASGLAVIAAAFLAGCVGAPAGTPAATLGGRLVVNSCGGAYGEAIRAAYLDPFAAATGVEVVYDENCDDQPAQLAAQAEADQVQWDVIAGFGGPIYADLHDRGLLATIDHAALGSATMELTGDATPAYGLGFHHDAVVLGYRQSAFPGRTPTVADFFDLGEFPGPRGMSQGGFEDWTRPAIALVADGVEPADLIPLDWDRAFAKLDAVKQDIAWYRGGTEMMNVIIDGPAVMCLCSDARMLRAHQQDPDIVLAFEGGLRGTVYWAVPADAPNPAAALAFLRWTLDPARQADFTQRIGYSGVVSASYEQLPEDLQALVLANPANFALTWSFTDEQNEWLAENAADASERYAEWVSR